MRSALYIICMVCLLSACGSINYVDIETYNPAEITFPENVGKLLIVNNAVPQPSDVGYTYSLYGKDQDTCRAKADSALMDACRSLGKSIVDVSYFNDVLLYNGSTRSDHVYYSDNKLTSAQVTALCEANGADAIVSFDRLLFEMSKDVTQFAEGYVMGLINVRIAGVLRSYLPGREIPLATVYVADSLLWAESADHMKILEKILPDPDNALRAAGQYIGAKATPNFVPHWMNESRWYFTGMGALWKEASAYAASEKWELAAERWQKLYAKGNWKAKARAASNLALCEEMNGDLPKAHEWATRSYDLFKANSGDENNYTQLLKLYVEALSQRIQKDKKLNVQFGEETL